MITTNLILDLRNGTDCNAIVQGSRDSKVIRRFTAFAPSPLSPHLCPGSGPKTRPPATLSGNRRLLTA